MAEQTVHGEQIGSVISMTGSAWAISGDSQRPLTEGAPVYEGEEIVTESDSNVEIRLADDTVLGQGEDSAIRLDDYFYTEDDGGLEFHMIKGVLRVVSGEIVKANPEGFNLSTPMATIGIRGTEVMVQIDQGREIIGVDEMGEGHHVVISNAFNEVIIDQAGMFSGVDFDGSLIVPDEMPENFISAVVRAAPLTILGDPPREPGESQQVTPPQFFETIDNQTGEVAPGEGMEVAEGEGEEEEEFDEEFELSEEEIEALLELETAAGTEETGGPTEQFDSLVDPDYDPFGNDPNANTGDPPPPAGSGAGSGEGVQGEPTGPPPDDDTGTPEAPPQAAEQDEAGENEPVTFNVLDGEDDSTLVAAEISDEQPDDTDPEGEVTFESDGNITYTPGEGEDGTVLIEYTVEDSDGEPTLGQLTIELADDSEPEITVGDATGAEDGSVITASGVITADFGADSEGSSLILDAPDATWDGESTLTADDGSWMVELTDDGYDFTQLAALADASGTDAGDELSVTVTATAIDSDGDVASGDFTVTLTDDGPTAESVDLTQAVENADITHNIFEGEDATPGVFEGTTVSAQVITGGGSVSALDNGEITYTPAAGEETPVTIEYTVTDVDGDVATSTMTITMVPDSAPEITVEPGVAEAGDGVMTASGDISVTFGNDAASTIELASDFGNWDDGTLTAKDGTWKIELNESGTGYEFTQFLPMVAAANAPAGTEFSIPVSVVATDNEGTVNSGSFTVTVTDDGPTAGSVDLTQLAENADITHNIFTGEDADATPGVFEGTTVSAQVITGGGSVSALDNGEITYTPAAGEEAPVTIEYTVTDVDGDVATSTMTITMVPDSAPEITVEPGVAEAGDGVMTASGDISVTFGNDAASTIELASDFGNWEDGTLTAKDGTWKIELNESGTGYEFTLLAPMVAAANAPAGTEFSIPVSVVATDNEGTVNSGSFTVTVTDDGPTAGSVDLTQLAENTDITHNIFTGEDADATPGVFEGTTVSAQVITGGGSVSAFDNGDIIYTPAEGEETPVTIEYTVTDVDGDEAVNTMTITMVPDSDPEITVSDSSGDEDLGLVETYGDFSVSFGEDTLGSSFTLVADDATFDGTTLSDNEGKWEIELQPDGGYKFTQLEAFEADPSGIFSLDVAVTATDSEGEVETDSFTVSVDLADPVGEPEPEPEPPSNLLINGDFSNVSTNFGSWIAANASSVEGWEAGKSYKSDNEGSRNYQTGGNHQKIEVWKAGFKGVLDPSGNNTGNFVEIDYAGATDFISQTVATVEGTVYTLSFWATIRPDAIPGETLIAHAVDGDTIIAGEVYAPEVYDTGDNSGWTEYTFTFTAQSDETTIRFTEPEFHDEGNAKNTYGVLIDDITMYADPDYDGDADELDYHIAGTPGDDVIFGNAGDDSIDGGRGSDSIFGNEGDDTVYGDKGSESISGGEDDDVLYGNKGADTIAGDEGDDQLYGGQQNDVLMGGEGDDELSGGKHHDLLAGGAGDDTLEGGHGNDTFVFTSPLDGTDTILDFKTAQDQIALYENAFDLNMDNHGNVDSSQFTSVSSATFDIGVDNLGDNAGLIYENDTGNLYYHDPDATTTDTLLATITDNDEEAPDLTAGDIDIV